MGRQDDCRQSDERPAGDADRDARSRPSLARRIAARPCEKLIVDLGSDPQMYARGEAFKAELLANPLFIDQAKMLWARGRERPAIRRSRRMRDAIAHSVRTGAARLRPLACGGSASARRSSTAASGRVAQRLAVAYRLEIGGYIERVVRNWDSTTLVERLELQVGKDLQFIRINGTLVGGLVGLLIFIASKWIAPG